MQEQTQPSRLLLDKGPQGSPLKRNASNNSVRAKLAFTTYSQRQLTAMIVPFTLMSLVTLTY